MRRGDLVTVALAGDFGKPRPAVVVQADVLPQSDTVLVCLVTSEIRDAPFYRVDLQPGPPSGLRVVSQAMIDKIFAVRRGKCGGPIGKLPPERMRALDAALAVVIGLADPLPA